MIKNKIKTQEEIIRIARRYRQCDKKIMTINGSFDLSHFGHIGALEEVKAVFLDRDGTINFNQPEYLYQKKDFKFASHVIPALQKLSQINYKIIILTNQSGIGRGYFKQKDLVRLHQWMLKELRRKKIRIDQIYYCPHHPNYGCDCRKPKIGLLMRAAKDFNLNLSKSWMIGDDEKDVLAGREVNAKTIKIGDRLPGRAKIQPNYYAKNLLKAVDIISKNTRDALSLSS